MPSGKSKTNRESTPQVIEGSGNVFADLNVPNPDLALAKAELVQHIRDLIAVRGLTQSKAGELLDLDQPKVSALVRGNVSGFSIDRLFRFLNALGEQVEISVTTPRAKAQADRKIFVTH
jgi:predicted XRE-type DNA-binding protein